MKIVTIPEYSKPWYTCRINNKEYRFPAGATMEVPDEVADLIENYYNSIPKPAPEAGKPGDVWTRTENGADWQKQKEYSLPAATLHKIGGVYKVEGVAKPEDADDLVDTVSAIIDALTEAGIMGTPASSAV